MKNIFYYFTLIVFFILMSGCGKNSSTSPENGTIEIDMVTVPAGSFKMGSDWENDPDNPDKGEGYFLNEQPIHTVNLDSFMMSVTEITQEKYESLMGNNPSYLNGDNLPVEQVSWEDAVKFCNRLSKLHGLELCYDEYTLECDFIKDGYRLPTEAEWEYACRAGTTTKYYTGDDENDLKSAGWYSSNSHNTSHLVGQKEPNTWGLYDMHGNVQEWCNTWLGSYSSQHVHNPIGDKAGYFRVIRGGFYGGWLFYCRAAYRNGFSTRRRDKFIGFRVVSSIKH